MASRASTKCRTVAAANNEERFELIENVHILSDVLNDVTYFEDKLRLDLDVD